MVTNIYITISKDGHCTIDDYINNLVPRDDSVHGLIYESLCHLLEVFLPYIESVYSYVDAICPIVHEGIEDTTDYNPNPPLALKHRHIQFCDQHLQVIPKILDYELKCGQSHEGVWHVEGKDEADHIYSTMHQDRLSSFNDFVYTGLVPLGTVETRGGQLIVFPTLTCTK